MSGAFFLGREPVELNPATTSGFEKLYSAQRLDGETISSATFEHCTFANLSFKNATLERCKFVNCAFVDDYFRHTSVVNCSFEGCKFVESEFDSPEFIDCTFAFIEFRRCFIPFRAFKHALPTDPGHRHRIADELAREAGKAGELRDARGYRLIGEDAYEQHLANLVWGSGGKYYEKSRPSRERFEAARSWLARKFNRHLWGYGERGTILARCFLIVGAFVFPALFWLLASDDLSHQGDSLSIAEFVLFSFDNLLAATGFSDVDVEGMLTRWLTGFEVFTGLVFIGLFISLVFNWIRRR